MSGSLGDASPRKATPGGHLPSWHETEQVFMQYAEAFPREDRATLPFGTPCRCIYVVVSSICQALVKAVERSRDVKTVPQGNTRAQSL
jgi:hypothetical protein